MINNRRSALIALLSLILGISGWLTFSHMITRTLDDRGLLIPGSIHQWILLLLAVIAAAAAVLAARKETLGEAGPVSGIASLFMAAGILSLLRWTPDGPQILLYLHKGVLLLAAAGMAVSGVLLLMKKKAPYLCTLPLSIFGILHLVVCYQQWNERPQFPAYIFGAAAVVCFMVFAYGLLERAAGMKRKGVTVFFALLGVFAAGCAAGQGETDLFFAAIASGMALELLGACPAES